MLIEKKNVAELLPADYNPRKDLKPGDKEYEKLKRSIETLRLSIVSSGMNKDGNTIRSFPNSAG